MIRAVLPAALVACLLLAGPCAGWTLPDGPGTEGPGPLPLSGNFTLPARTAAAQDWYNLGFALTGEERFDEAVSAYEQALAANHSHLNAWYYLGDALFRLGRPREALLAFENATAIDPDFVDAYFYESRIYGELGLHREEQETLGRGLEAADRRKAKEEASSPAPAGGSLPQPVSPGTAVLGLLAAASLHAYLGCRKRE